MELNAIAYLRETFKEEDTVRVHYVISEGGASIKRQYVKVYGWK